MTARYGEETSHLSDEVPAHLPGLHARNILKRICCYFLQLSIASLTCIRPPAGRIWADLRLEEWIAAAHAAPPPPPAPHAGSAAVFAGVVVLAFCEHAAMTPRERSALAPAHPPAARVEAAPPEHRSRAVGLLLSAINHIHARRADLRQDVAACFKEGGNLRAATRNLAAA
jgi:hypothetical protein